MSNSMKGIYLAATMIILCALITFSIVCIKMGKSSYDQAEEPLSNQLTNLDEAKYSKYAGDTIYGNEVQYCIRNFDDLLIKVTTNNSVSIDSENNVKVNSFTNKDIIDTSKSGYASFNSMLDSESKYYVNPSAIFAGRLKRDKKNVIVGIEFIQQNYNLADKHNNDTYTEQVLDKAISKISDGIYNWSEIKNFLATDLASGYVKYSVTVDISGNSYFYSYNNPFDDTLSCEDDTLFLAKVNESTNNNVYIEFVEQTSESASAIAVVLEKYRTANETQYMLVYGNNIVSLLSDFSSNSPFKMNVQTYTNKVNSMTTYWNQAPFLTNEPGTDGYVNPEAFYLTKLDGTYDPSDDMNRSMSISFVNSNIRKGVSYDITGFRSLISSIVTSKDGDTINVFNVADKKQIDLDKLESLGSTFTISSITLSNGTGICTDIGVSIK